MSKSVHGARAAQAFAYAFALLAYSTAFAADLTRDRAAKPYRLELRYGDLPEDTDVQTMLAANRAPPPAFLHAARRLAIDIDREDAGHAATRNAALTYRVAPTDTSRVAITLTLKLVEADGESTLTTTASVQPGHWLLLAADQNTSRHGSRRRAVYLRVLEN